MTHFKEKVAFSVRIGLDELLLHWHTQQKQTRNDERTIRMQQSLTWFTLALTTTHVVSGCCGWLTLSALWSAGRDGTD